MAGPDDLDQFLNEVLARRRGPAPAKPHPQPQAIFLDAEDDVVVLQPTGGQQPPPARARQQGGRARRPARRKARPQRVETKPARPKKKKDGPDELVSAEEMRQAASAPITMAVAPHDRVRHTVDPAVVAGQLRSPAEVRKAIILSELLGPPRARRGR